MIQVQQDYKAQEEKYVAKVKELEYQYNEKTEQMRLALEYKTKC